MTQYDFANFIEGIKNMSWHEMLEVANKRCLQLENTSHRVKGSVRRREEGNLELAGKIKGLLFWLGTGSKPAGLSESDFYLLKPLCLNLVEKKQLKPGALGIFG